MADMFLTITRANIKAGSEKDARALLEKSLLPGDGSKPSDHVPGLIGFGLMRSKKDASMFGLATVWKDEASFDALSKNRSEEHTSELQSLMRISYAVFCLKKKKKTNQIASMNRKKRR